MDDLVKRLRGWPPSIAHNVMQDAADRIEALEARIAKAVEVMNTYCDPMNMEPKHEQFLSQLNKEFPDE